MRIRHEQIYQALCLQGAGCLRQQLRVDKALRSGRARRLPRLPLAGLPRRSRRPWIEGPRSACTRPRSTTGPYRATGGISLVISAGGRSALIILTGAHQLLRAHRPPGGCHSSETVTTAVFRLVLNG